MDKQGGDERLEAEAKHSDDNSLCNYRIVHKRVVIVNISYRRRIVTTSHV